MLTIAHLINPVNAPPASDLRVAQPVTFASMRAAQRFAAQYAPDELRVDLYAVHYAEDAPVAPADFKPLPLLERSVLDLGDFQVPRKLPLLQDLLERLYAASDADYLVYTNVDISLQPHFYPALARLIGAGHDAFVINRRTISNAYTAVADLPRMWAAVGKPHPGWDCFVFPRALFPRFDLGHVCLGAPRVALALIANLVALSPAFYEFTGAHLTFHLGDDQTWSSPALIDFDRHNTREAEAVLARLEAKYGRFPRHTPPGRYLLRKRLLGKLYPHAAHTLQRWRRRLGERLSPLGR